MLDLRLPAGLFFAAVGAILLILGVTNPADRAPLTPLNVNLVVGIFMIVFGSVLLFLARRGKA
jgi:uncharacterized membrane protein HdeD (DUF308 family)